MTNNVESVIKHHSIIQTFCYLAGCRRDQFTCESDGQCLPDSARCNGIIECEDRSDELNCGKLILNFTSLFRVSRPMRKQRK